MTRWTRDNRVLVGVGAGLGAVLTAAYAFVLRARSLPPTAATNRVLLFVLFYIVVLLILVLLFVLARSAVRLLFEARRGVFGSRFRVRVVATHVGLALLPIALLVLPTTGLLQRSVDFWFSPPVADTIRAGRELVERARLRGAARERRVAEALAPELRQAADGAARLAALSAARERSGLDYLEWRPAGGAAAVAVSSSRWPVRDLNDPGPDWIGDARARGFARRLDAVPGGGQATRTVASFPEGLLVVGAFEVAEDAAPLRELSRATSAYASLEAERASLEAVQVLLFLLLALVVLLAAVWIGLVLARRVTRPIAALAASARRVGAGDFDAFVDVEGGDEIGALSGAFNAMTSELKASRQRLVAANADLAESNRRLDEARERVRTILAHLDAGVLAFADDGTLVATNEAALRMTGRSPDPLDAPSLDALLAGPALAPLRDFLAEARAGGPREATLTVQDRGEARVLEARVARLPAREGETPAWVATLEDTTALVRAERAAAWEEAARRVAHEIKNPLTPIRLAAERMRRKAAAARSEDAPPGGLASVVEEGASTIVEEVGTLAGLVDAFGRFARLPHATLADTDLAAVVQQVTSLFRVLKPGVAVTADVAAPLPLVKADAEQVKRALVNLVDNAVAATPAGGTVRVRASVEDGRARLVVADDGPGIPAGDRGRIFDPAFSTKPKGTGLGLAITSRIAAEHGGRLTVEENRPRGSLFTFEWPAA